MSFEFLKTIIFIATLILLLFRFFLDKIKDKTTLQFLISSAVITSLLILIVTVKLHHYLRIEFNIPNTVTYILTTLPFIYHFYTFREIILKSKYFVLIISLLLFCTALLLDLLTDGKIISFSSSDLVEELLRILGAMFWLIYYTLYISKIHEK
jgi:hypothetical protein